MVYLNEDGQITLLAGTNAPEHVARFVTVYRPSGAEQHTDIPGGSMAEVIFPIKNMQGIGQYDWSLSVQTPAYGELCKQTGTFIVVGRESTRAQERTIH
jgi:hypothetical protein